jgi:hypothetical protein
MCEYVLQKKKNFIKLFFKINKYYDSEYFLTAPLGIHGHAILAILLLAWLAFVKKISPFSSNNALHLSIPASILK